MGREPKVTLVSHTLNPISILKTVWDISKTSKGFSSIHLEAANQGKEAIELFEKVVAMEIPVAEFINFVFTFENVPLYFRAQLVRQRKASYWAQSMRILDLSKFHKEECFYTPKSIRENKEALHDYRQLMLEVQKAYTRLLGQGIPMEDARAVVPQGATTRISMQLDLRQLIYVIKERSCITGDTKIPLLDGTEVPIKDLPQDEDFWVYSLDKELNVVAGQARSFGITRKHVPILRVTLDNGKVVRCTEDHRFMLRTGEYKEAQELKSGDSLMPLYRSTGKTRMFKDYETVYNPKSGQFELTHHRTIRGESPGKGYLRHHKNWNKHDNRPEKLVWMTVKEHRELHYAALKHWMSKNKKRVSKRASAMFQALWEDSSFRKLATARNRRNGILFGKSSGSYQRFIEWVRSSEGRATIGEAAKRTWADEEKRSAIVKKMKVNAIRQWQDLEIRSRMVKGMSQSLTRYQSEIRQELCGTCGTPIQVVYRKLPDEIEWERYSGHFCSTACRNRFIAKCKMDESLVLNHKVVSVEACGFDDVYDLTVDHYHNFAVSSGVFIHNCHILQGSIWKPLINQIINELTEKVDPVFKMLRNPICFRGGKYIGCRYSHDNERRLNGIDKLPPCCIWIKQNHIHPERIPDVESYIKGEQEMLQFFGEDILK